MQSTGKITELSLTDNKITLENEKGKWYFYLDKNLKRDGLAIGEFIECEYYQPEGKKYKVIKSFQKATNTTLSPKPTAYNSPQIGDLTEPALRFISNVVSSAIQSGKCDATDSVKAWSLAAYDALQALKDKTSGN